MGLPFSLSNDFGEGLPSAVTKVVAAINHGASHVRLIVFDFVFLMIDQPAK